ncbi:hypothetical protein [Streptomyces thermocarboxydus]|uniref:Uncharacterized protein n=1 Tax=Streptomyces thermocarboxydus TaxID=59299 RepID=A0ABU3JHT1_9ACTN|nr:hypothetical protein [Streptomyces thermocarboxydus]
MFQLQPQLYAAVQPHAAQEAVGQADLSVAVSAQRALQGEQPGRGGGETRQCCGEVGEHFAYALLLCRAEWRCDARRARRTGVRLGAVGTEQGGRHDGGAAHRRRAGGAGIGQPPGTAAAVARQGEQNGPRAAAVAGVPVAAQRPALAGAQMPGQRVGAGMAGQMSEGG